MAVSKMVHDGMVVNSLRGMDSTGVFQRDRKDVTFTNKLAVNGAEFVKDKYSMSFISDADQAVYTVVHNRAATEGKVSQENAHPFEALDEETYNYTCGVHNGTLTGWKDKPLGKNFEVDSQWAINHINVHGDDAFKDINGAYAIVWNSDVELGVLKMVRNHARPLFFVYVKDEDRMIFASEYQMITWIAERNNIVLEPNIYELQPSQIYSFSVENPREFTKKPVPYLTSEDYDKRRRDEYIREVEGILKPSKARKALKKQEEKAAREAAAVKSTALVPVASSVAAAIEEGGMKSKYCTLEESRLAKSLGVLRTEVSFEKWYYDKEAKEWWGFFGEGNDIATCIMRNVDKATFDTLDRAKSLTCRIVGAIPGPIGGKADEPTYIVSRNIVAIEEEEDLEAAIKESMRLHNEEKLKDAIDDDFAQAGFYF